MACRQETKCSSGLIGFKWEISLNGVPEGSVLEHILLIIYVNDLEEGVPSKKFKFADDTKHFSKKRKWGYTTIAGRRGYIDHVV